MKRTDMDDDFYRRRENQDSFYPPVRPGRKILLHPRPRWPDILCASIIGIAALYFIAQFIRGIIQQ